jgi:hypothetical protein
MRDVTLALVIGTLSLCGCHAQQPPPQLPSSILPLRTLRLYETGMGYFERTGQVPASSSASLPVPAGHLDDALKTLVVLGTPGASRVHGVVFGSSMSRGMARALAGLPQDADAAITYRDLLVSLKGAPVDVKLARGSLSGRIIDVLDAPARPGAADRPSGAGSASGDDKAKASAPAAELTVLLVTGDSEIHRLHAADIVSVRPTDPAFAARLDSALDALSARGALARRQLRVLAASSGPVTLGYVAESPIWRTTYRVVLDPKGGSGTLQGWALVHNDTDEDWRGVHMELVNGRPDSFLFPLAAPRYARRGLVQPEQQLSTVPQLLDKTVDAIWGDNIGEAYAAGGLGLSGVGEGGGGRGEGIGLGSIGTVGHGAGTGGGSSSVVSGALAVGNLADIARADGVESGALFVYSLAEPLDLGAHASALVPFVQQAVDARPLALFESPGASARAAVRFVNSTAQTLPAGPIAFFAAGGFAGEAALDRLKPRERRFIQFGADLDVELSVQTEASTEELRKLGYEAGALTEHFLRRSRRMLAIENRSGQERTVALALDVVSNARVTGADELDFDTAASRPLALFKLAPRQRLDRRLDSEEGLSRATALSALRSARLVELAAVETLSDAERRRASEAAARQKELEETRVAMDRTKADIAAVDKDLERLREHLKAMGEKAHAAGPNPFVQRILAAEDKLAALRKKLEAGEQEAEQRRKAVKAALEKLKG